MKYALDVSTASTYSDPLLLADLAAEAESAGWEGFFVWDAVFARPADLPMCDPWTALAAVAMRTSRIRIGAMVTPLPRRRPWQIARITASLDHLSKGRLVFGVGLGYQALDFDAFGEDPDPRVRGEKLDEGLEIITRLWTGRRVSLEGKHYQLKNVKFSLTPVQRPRIPIWVAGYWPNRKPFRRAARFEGLLPGTEDGSDTPELLRKELVYIQAHRTRPDPIDVAVYGATSPNATRAGKIVRPWSDAGATWWREGIGDWRGSLRTVRARIRSGPPSI